MNRTVNSTNNEYVIECKDGKYRICNINGTVPKNCDCVITGWHIKNGKIIKKGKVEIIKNGNGSFHIKNNIIEK